MEPFPELSTRTTILHVRTYPFSDRIAPFIRQTVLGLRPYVRNVVLTPSTDCSNPPDISIELTQLKTYRHPLRCMALSTYLRKKYPFISLVMGHMGNGTRSAWMLSRTLGVPFLGTFGGSDVNVEIAKEEYRSTYLEVFKDPSAHFLTVAGYLRDKLIEYGAPRERLFVWHRGVNLADFQVAPPRLSSTNQTVRLVVSARFYEVKGHEYVVRALAILRRQGKPVELLLLGDGPLLDQMKALVSELGVGDAVHFIGHVSHIEVKQYLHSADIYVHPSVTCAEGRTEGIPNAILEACATGLPVVATHHGGIGEVVVDGETGFLVPERDPEQLAHCIGKLVENRELRAMMGRRGRAHIEREFNLSIQARQLAARILHTIKAGELFKMRGWPLHVAPAEPLDHKNPRLRPPVALDTSRLVSLLVQPDFKSRRRYIGWLHTTYRKAVWFVLFRPYVRFIDRKLKRFMELQFSKQQRQFSKQLTALGTQFSDDLATMIDSINTHSAATPRLVHARESETELLMSSALCPDCPHCPPSAPWPDKPCPIDAACLTRLHQEFSASQAGEPPPSRIPGHGESTDSLSVSDADISADGRLPHEDAQFRRLYYAGDLQKVNDIPRLLREFRRILKPEGELRMEVWPLPRGRDGARLLGDVAIPFAQLFFPDDAIGSFVGPVLRPPRYFDSDDLQRWASDAGLTLHEQMPLSHEDPCEMYVQARFAPLFRKAGWSRAQLARSFVATFHAVTLQSAAESIPSSDRGRQG